MSQEDKEGNTLTDERLEARVQVGVGLEELFKTLPALLQRAKGLFEDVTEYLEFLKAHLLDLPDEARATLFRALLEIEQAERVTVRCGHTLATK